MKKVAKYSEPRPFHLLKYPLIGVLIFLTGCTQKFQKKKGVDQLQEIVLVNVGNVDRCEIGELINAISKCNPKVIGVNLLFTEERDHPCDSILQQSISESTKIVLVEGYQNDSPVKSITKFRKPAYRSGHNGLLTDERGAATSYERLVDHERKLTLTFPFLVALEYNKARTAELSTQLSGEEYPIVFYHTLNDFKLVDRASVLSNCDALKEKLVLVGYLGPDEGDLVITNVSGRSTERTYATVIQANIILDILYELE